MRLLRILGLVLLLPVAGYLAAAFVLSRVPVAGEAAVRDGVELFVCTNGVHTDLVLPAEDWRGVLDRGDFPGAHPWTTHYSFGWGDRAFYLETRGWGDLRPATAVAAVVGGGPTVVHVGALWSPAESPDCGTLLLERDRYRRLLAYVRGSFRLDGEGRAIPLRGRSYGPTDMFYEAVGVYRPWLTCNEWTARGLRVAGVTMGMWTPFEGGVMRWVR